MDITLHARSPSRVMGDKEYDMSPSTMMILGHDLVALCDGMMEAETHGPGFTDAIVVDVRLARAPRHQDSFTDYFSKTTQESLLAPLRMLRNMDRLTIAGHVSSKIAASVEEDARTDEWVMIQKNCLKD